MLSEGPSSVSTSSEVTGPIVKPVGVVTVVSVEIISLPGSPLNTVVIFVIGELVAVVSGTLSVTEKFPSVKIVTFVLDPSGRCVMCVVLPSSFSNSRVVILGVSIGGSSVSSNKSYNASCSGLTTGIKGLSWPKGSMTGFGDKDGSIGFTGLGFP